jgi:ribosomal protein L11 methyltransferase
MKNAVIWKISVVTTAEAEDAATELLSRIFASSASAYTDIETRTTTAAVFCERRPPELQAKREALRAGLQRIKLFELDVGAGRVRIQKLPRQDWAESWKRHFKPIEIGNALLLKPSWSKRRPRPDQAVVVLDPGLSFGTGQHPTTEFCLRELERGRSPSAARESGGSNRNFQRTTTTSQPAATGDRSRSFLDIGTGSGILAIAAAKLGYSPVHAFDFDPEAVRVALSNARINGVNSKIRITRADVTKPPRRYLGNYDVVCANLISTLLISERRTIATLVRRNGVLVLAGILKSEFCNVQAAYKSLGFKLVASKAEKEWRSGIWHRDASAT